MESETTRRRSGPIPSQPCIAALARRRARLSSGREGPRVRRRTARHVIGRSRWIWFGPPTPVPLRSPAQTVARRTSLRQVSNARARVATNASGLPSAVRCRIRPEHRPSRSTSTNRTSSAAMSAPMARQASGSKRGSSADRPTRASRADGAEHSGGQEIVHHQRDGCSGQPGALCEVRTRCLPRVAEHRPYPGRVRGPEDGRTPDHPGAGRHVAPVPSAPGHVDSVQSPLSPAPSRLSSGY
jgi:hypothetical protein